METTEAQMFDVNDNDLIELYEDEMFDKLEDEFNDADLARAGSF